MKKLIAIVLALVTCLATVSCATGTGEEGTSAPDNSSTNTGESEDTGEPLELPEFNFNGKTLTFLVRGSDAAEWQTVDIYAENLKSEPVNDAVYQRNDLIQNKYNVQIAQIPLEGSETAQQKVSTEVRSGTGEFQAAVTQLSEAASIATQNLLYDLNSSDISHMNLEKSWWDTKAANELSVDGKLYYATGDLLTSDNDGTFIIMFNKTIMADKNLGDIYELVNNKQWTFAKMYEFEQNAIESVDGQLQYDDGIIGFAVTSNVPYSLFYGAGLSVVKKNNQDIPEYSLDIERVADAIDAAIQVMSKDVSLDMEVVGNKNVVENGLKCFGEGHALFYGECLQCVTRLRAHKLDFGVIPYPMLNEAQGEYYSHMNGVGGMVSILKSVTGDNLEMTCAMIEAMAYYSKQYLTPAYYEKNLILKGLKDEESGPMVDLILQTRVYDLAYVYGWSGATGSIRAMIAGGRNQIASQASRWSNSLKKEIQKFMNTVE